MARVSIIIPVYNKEDYLGRTIESVIQQSLSDIEIILINDGSTDNSLEVCQDYEKKDSRIIVINQKNQGVSVARNEGILHASGEYVGFVDADDTIDKNMYLNMYNRCINDNSEVCMCNYVEYNASRKEIYNKVNIDFRFKKQEEIINEIISDMIAPELFDGKSQVIMGSACRFLIKRDILIKELIRFVEDISLMEDLIFCIDLLTSVTSLSIDHSYYYQYYSIENSASKKYRKNYHENSLRVTNYLISLLIEKDKYGIFEDRLNNRIFLTSMGSIVNVASTKNKSSILEKLKEIKSICSNPQLKRAMSKIDKKYLSQKNRLKFHAMYNEDIILLYIYHFIAIRKESLF